MRPALGALVRSSCEGEICFPIRGEFRLETNCALQCVGGNILDRILDHARLQTWSGATGPEELREGSRGDCAAVRSARLA